MKRIAILVPEGAVTEAVADPRYLFNTANQFLMSQGKEALFDVRLVGLNKTVLLHDKAFSANVDHTLDEKTSFDLVIIPALSGDLEDSVRKSKAMIPWIKQQREGGAEVASLCLGAFLLAASGLLDHKECSTHWAFGHLIEQMFPEVTYIDGKIISEDDGIYSSGGANSYWNLLLYLLEKYTNREMAVLASKYFALDIGRDNQSQFSIFQGQKDHNDETVISVQDYIEHNFGERIVIEEMASEHALSKRTLERKFKAATKNSIGEYVKRVRIEAAKKLLEENQMNINEIIYEVGYSDSKAFRNAFTKYAGMSPSDYRKKFIKLAV